VEIKVLISLEFRFNGEIPLAKLGEFLYELHSLTSQEEEFPDGVEAR
jgi:hypothetical protein